MNEQRELFKALTKKAKGFSAEEISEEYQADEEGNLTLTKRKVNTKYFPPDATAVKCVMEFNGFEDLSEEELVREKHRLLAEFSAINKKNEESNEKKSK